MKYVSLILLLCRCAYAHASTKDTLVYIRFVSAADSTPLRFAEVGVNNATIQVNSWQTDADGYIRINLKAVCRQPHAFLILHYPGFEQKAVRPDTVPARDTIVIRLQRSELDKIVVTAYRQPLLYKKLRYGQRRRMAKMPNPQPVHSVKQCLAHEALQKGLWLNKGTMTRNVILAWDSVYGNYKYRGEGLEGMLQRYLLFNISYPRQAQQFFMEETVYVDVEFDEKGSVQYVKVIQGKHTDLVLEVVNALARMPRLGVFQHQKGYPAVPKPVRFFVPGKFVLK